MFLAREGEQITNDTHVSCSSSDVGRHAGYSRESQGGLGREDRRLAPRTYQAPAEAVLEGPMARETPPLSTESAQAWRTHRAAACGSKRQREEEAVKSRVRS